MEGEEISKNEWELAKEEVDKDVDRMR